MAWATHLRARLAADPFTVAKFRLLGLCLILSFVLIATNMAMDILVLRPTIHEVIGNAGAITPEDGYAKVEAYLVLSRLSRLILFIAVLYFVAGFAVRPLRVASDLQRRFIASVSHELKTPLAIKKTTTEVALRKGEQLSRDEAVAILKQNLTETERLSSIVGYMIALFDPSTNRASYHNEKVALDAVAAKVLTLAKHKAETSDVRITADMGGLSVTGNRVAL